jgi:amino acid adenylation domain-containing protein
MQNQLLKGFRLSPQQGRLWSAQQSSNAYRAQCAMLIEGELSKGVLHDALRKVVKRHEILRTTYQRQSGLSLPFQVIGDDAAPGWEETDLTHLKSSEQPSAIESLFDEAGRASFDPESGSALQTRLLKLSPEAHVLLISLPAICADAWTLKNLFKEVCLHYAAASGGEELPCEAFQYADFSEWQNELLQDEESATARDFWNNRIPLNSSAMSLPFEAAPSERTGFKVESLRLGIEPELRQRIEESARRYEVEPAILLLSCWQVLMWRLTGELDIVVGYVCDGRSFEELHGALGLFARTLPVSCHVGAGFRFAEILARTHQSIAEARRWQDYFLIEQSSAPDANDPPQGYFPVIFEYQEWPSKATVAGLSFSVIKQQACFDQFKIKLSCASTEQSLTLELQYAADIFRAEQVRYLPEQLSRLIESVIENSEARLDELELMGEAERHQLLIEFNQTARDYSTDKCIDQLFEEQVARTPDSIALVFEETRLTYRELNARANQLAHYLRGMGVKPETLVAIWLDRSAEMIVALLAILKAGGAYLPLDLAQPKERVSHMLDDAKPIVILTEQRHVERLPLHRSRVVCMDLESDAIEKNTVRNLLRLTSAGNLIYVIYTSGSTGKPKGVCIEHRQLHNYLNGILPLLNLPPQATYATVSTLAADLGNTAIFPALCTGGCLHIISNERVADAEQLADYFSHHPVDCLKIVPSHLEALLSGSHASQILPRRRLILGGEASRIEWVEKLRELAPDCVVINHYGPTETTVGVLTYRVADEEAALYSQTLPLGRPIANTQIYLLDAQPVPFWLKGELHVGGDNLARGYLNHPELTAEKFVPNPFARKHGERLYRTGDLARHLPGGKMEFLGRVDYQVKIRGFRVELGEIEATLRQYPDVRQAVVVVREGEAAEKRMIAYVVLKPGSPLMTGDLRRFILRMLPDYMLPSAFVLLDSLPLLPNGKIDRATLPTLDAGVESDESFVAPRTVLEEVLADIWIEVLGLERVSVHDPFFELGGHSLLAIQLTSQLRDTFQMDLPPGVLFEASTVAKLAGVMVANEAQPGQAERIAAIIQKIKRMSDEDATETLDAQKGAFKEKESEGDEA